MITLNYTQRRSDGEGGIWVNIPSQNQSLNIILCTNCSNCRQAGNIYPQGKYLAMPLTTLLWNVHKAKGDAIQYNLVPAQTAVSQNKFGGLKQEGHPAYKLQGMMGT